MPCWCSRTPKAPASVRWVRRARDRRSGSRARWTAITGAALGFVLFAVGGIIGVIGFDESTRVPAHYHGMVGAVTIAYMGLVPDMLKLTGRRPWSARRTRWQPYLYGLGLVDIMVRLHGAGVRGAPRKARRFAWADAQAPVAMNLMGPGSLLAIAGGLAFVTSIGVPLPQRERRHRACTASALSASQAFAFDEGARPGRSEPS